MPMRLLTIDEAGGELGVSRSTVWRLVRRGELGSVRKGGRRLVRMSGSRAGVRLKKTPAIATFSEDHPIFRLAGAGRGGGSGPGARDKHAILDGS